MNVIDRDRIKTEYTTALLYYELTGIKEYRLTALQFMAGQYECSVEDIKAIIFD